MAMAATAARDLASGGMASSLEIYLGTMTFGWSQASSTVDTAVAGAMTRHYLASGGRQIDTARIYSGGLSEEMLGDIFADPEVSSKSYILSTKVHPSQPGGLSKKGVRSQVEASLKAMKVKTAAVLYLHQPDPENDLVETLECVQELLQDGTITSYGLSNYSALEVERCCSLCSEHGWSMPTLCQGLYNPLNRLIEAQLLPVLRRNSIGFVAYNPLAAGLLTGKHNPSTDVLPGRFKDNPNYLPRFYTEPNFAAVAAIKSACEEAGLDMLSATYAWMLRHSALDATHGDGLLLGASTMAQLEQNLTACQDLVELPAPVLAAFETAYMTAGGADAAFPYWRSYSRDQPGREELPPGASYAASKK